RTILMGLVALVAGILLRSAFGTVGLFAGTLVVGLSISAIMVLLPSIIKKQFPVNAGLMMGLYSTALAGGAAIAAGTTVPLEKWLNNDWRLALACWAIPALLAVFVWLWSARGGPTFDNHHRGPVPKLRRNWLAWQVTL